MLTRARRAALAGWRYVRYRVPELVVPSSMPDPPHVAAAEAAARLRPRRTLRQHGQARGCVRCAASRAWHRQLVPR